MDVMEENVGITQQILKLHSWSSLWYTLGLYGSEYYDYKLLGRDAV